MFLCMGWLIIVALFQNLCFIVIFVFVAGKYVPMLDFFGPLIKNVRLACFRLKQIISVDYFRRVFSYFGTTAPPDGC